MNAEGFERKLTAILSADAAGYSRLMGEDDEATVHTLTRYREMISAVIRQHQGRVVDSPGDNLLAEFESVLRCVSCALEIQRELAERNAELPDQRKMEYRIGVTIGDVIKEGGRIYGDGVNIAARLESLAEPGGICVSGLVFTQVKNKLKLEYEFLGKKTMKNISEPVPVYSVKSLPKAAAQQAGYIKPAPVLPDRPSIAVLPFVNMSKDPEQEYFSDGMAEEIIGALAKIEGLKVISRTSAFHFKGKDTNLRGIGEMLKVDHVLEGSVRKAGNRVRISAQLIKVADDTHLWADTYDRELEDVFAIQDEISQAVVQSLKVKLFESKAEPLVKDYTKNIQAYELFLKAIYLHDKGNFGKAIEYLEMTIRIDPTFVPAYVTLAGIYCVITGIESVPFKEMKPKINALLQKAIETDECYGVTYNHVGWLYMNEYNWPVAEQNLKKAIAINPNSSASLGGYSYYLAAVGRTPEAVEHARLAVELDPLSNFARWWYACCLVIDKSFDKAIKISKETLDLDENNIWGRAGLAFAYSGKGMYAEAISILDQNATISLWKATLGWCYGKSGHIIKATEILEDFLQQSDKGYFSPYYIAMVYCGLGEKDKAFEWLDRAYAVYDPHQATIKYDECFHDLYPDPRWQKALEKRGLIG